MPLKARTSTSIAQLKVMLWNSLSTLSNPTLTIARLQNLHNPQDLDLDTRP